MIDKKYARVELSRMSQMLNFPREEGSFRELVNALTEASSDRMANAVVTAFLSSATAETRCPMPSEVRRALYDAGAEQRDKQSKCPDCGGAGAVLCWFLVTFHGNSLLRKRTEALDVDHNGAAAFQERLAQVPEKLWQDRQEVVRAARQCPCMAVRMAS